MVTVLSYGGTGAAATTTLKPTAIDNITLTANGSGYTTAPEINFTGGEGAGAEATTILTPTTVESITLTAGGSDYTTAPTVTITGGEGTGATATATIAPLGEQAITWDVENRPVTIGSATYVYDGNGKRILKTENGETILYVNKYYEKNLTTDTVTVQYYVGGRLVAEMEGAVLRYFHQDILNSTSLVTDETGAVWVP